MGHKLIYKKDGIYGAFPILNQLPDGRLTVGLSLSPFVDHYAVGDWTVFVSIDEGESWKETDDSAIPATWPGTSPREISDRFAGVMPDGSYLCAGMVGYETWPSDRRSEAQERGLAAHDHPSDPGSIIVNRPTLFVLRSTDEGKTWDRQEWDVPGFRGTGFSRPTVLEDGTILEPIYGSDLDDNPQVFVWRGSNGGRTWRLHPVGSLGNETAFLEVSPGRVLALSRTEEGESGGCLVERWSDDGGITWSQALNTGVWTPNSPPHLLKLRDGRVLLTYGYRREPMGIRAVLSHDGGETWDTHNTVILRDDGGYACHLREDGTGSGGDIGYPHSIQLSDGSILTVFYITLEDRITHSAATRWEA